MQFDPSKRVHTAVGAMHLSPMVVILEYRSCFPCPAAYHYCFCTSFHCSAKRFCSCCLPALWICHDGGALSPLARAAYYLAPSIYRYEFVTKNHGATAMSRYVEIAPVFQNSFHANAPQCWPTLKTIGARLRALSSAQSDAEIPMHNAIEG